MHTIPEITSKIAVVFLVFPYHTHIIQAISNEVYRFGLFVLDTTVR